jgi:L-ascorbate metabolism protein UlaG (beta-lactamase superfamily)
MTRKSLVLYSKSPTPQINERAFFMKIQLIRNATMKITYGRCTILTDPMLAPKDKYEPFAGNARNPTIDLPFSVQEVISEINGVMVTHDHPDHFDPDACAVLPKEIPLFCQPGDDVRFIKEGFRSVTPITTSHIWEEVTIVRTGGQHGSGDILKLTGSVSGFVLKAKGEPTVYWVGDSIWCEPVSETIKTHQPDIIITHSGGAVLPGGPPIIMDDKQTLSTIRAHTEGVVVAIHMEALDHCTVTREDLRRMAKKASIPASRFFIPEDGETITF